MLRQLERWGHCTLTWTWHEAEKTGHGRQITPIVARDAKLIPPPRTACTSHKDNTERWSSGVGGDLELAGDGEHAPEASYLKGENGRVGRLEGGK